MQITKFFDLLRANKNQPLGLCRTATRFLNAMLSFENFKSSQTLTSTGSVARYHASAGRLSATRCSTQRTISILLSKILCVSIT